MATDFLKSLFGGSGNINVFSIWDIVQMLGRSGLFRSTLGRLPGTGESPKVSTGTGPDNGIQSEHGGKGYADEVLFLLAFVTKWADAHGVLVDRKLRPEDFGIFLEILRRLNASGRTKAADILTHVIGFKGATETIKVPKGVREVGKGDKKKTETIFAEHQREINPTGAHILVFFGEIGADKAVELLTESHILDNLEDKVTGAAKKAGVEASALQKAGDTTLHLGIAFHKLGYNPKLLRQVRNTPSLKKKREEIEATADPERKLALHEEYQALIVKRTKALLKASPQLARPGWSKSDKIIRIGVSALVVVFLLILGIK